MQQISSEKYHEEQNMAGHGATTCLRVGFGGVTAALRAAGQRGLWDSDWGKKDSAETSGCSTLSRECGDGIPPLFWKANFLLSSIPRGCHFRPVPFTVHACFRCRAKSMCILWAQLCPLSSSWLQLVPISPDDVSLATEFLSTPGPCFGFKDLDSDALGTPECLDSCLSCLLSWS